MTLFEITHDSKLKAFFLSYFLGKLDSDYLSRETADTLQTYNLALFFYLDNNTYIVVLTSLRWAGPSRGPYFVIKLVQ